VKKLAKKAYFVLSEKVTAFFKRNLILGMAIYLVWVGSVGWGLFGWQVGIIALIRCVCLLIIRYRPHTPCIHTLKAVSWAMVGISSYIVIMLIDLRWPLPWPTWILWPVWLKAIVFIFIEPPLMNWSIYCSLHPEHAKKTRKKIAEVSARITKKK